MKKSIKERLVKEVKHEALYLKKFATKEELSRLKKSLLDPTDQHRCIYGMMTQDCFSERSLELMKLCTSPFSSILKKDIVYSPVPTTYCAIPSEDAYDGRDWAFSPIEVFIWQNNERANNRLIDYLQDKTQVLNI